MPEVLHRKVIRITGHDSPNVRLAVEQQQAGQRPTGEIVTPGVLSWGEYQQRLALWDQIRICVGINARFYKGAELLLFPPLWLDAAERRAAALHGQPRQAKAIGIDPGEGVAQTAMAAVDELGVIELVSKKTPDTSVIGREAIAFGRRHNVPPECWLFDRGGGGRHVADELRTVGYRVRTIGFGDEVVSESRQVKAADRQDTREDRYAFVKRRAQMYGELSILLEVDATGNPVNGQGFAIPANLRGNPADPETELRHQLAPIPKLYDREGRLRMLPKNKRDPGSTEKCLVELLGHSPDEADAVVLAVHGVLHAERRPVVGTAR